MIDGPTTAGDVFKILGVGVLMLLLYLIYLVVVLGVATAIILGVLVLFGVL